MELEQEPIWTISPRSKSLTSKTGAFIDGAGAKLLERIREPSGSLISFNVAERTQLIEDGLIEG